MAINIISVQYNGGLLPDIILLTQGYFPRGTRLCVCVCVFSSHPFWTSSSLDVPAGVTQEEGHTGFLIHLPSAVRALIFVARRIQPFLSLVDREVEFCVLTNFNRSPPVGHFYFGFLVFSEKNSVCRDRTHVPTCQKVTRCRLSYRGRPALNTIY